MRRVTLKHYSCSKYNCMITIGKACNICLRTGCPHLYTTKKRLKKTNKSYLVKGYKGR